MVNTKKKENGGRREFAMLLCDFMFKRLFGSDANKDILIAFLNMVLEDKEIVHVDFISNEHLGLTEEDRKVIFDISAHCNDGENLIIEMQKGYQKHFRKRALYYTTYPINEQGRDARDEYVKALAQKDPHAKFNWDYNLKAVTVVSILNFRFNHYDEWPDDQPRSSYRLREDESHELMTDVLRFVFLELGRFNKRIDELESVSDKWIYLLKYMHTMTEIPPEFSDPMFTRLFLLSEINKFTADEYKQYTKSLENMGDYTNIINTAAEEAEIRGRAIGREEGLAEGRAEGEAAARLEDARRFKELGVAVDIISQATGLSVETIESL